MNVSSIGGTALMLAGIGYGIYGILVFLCQRRIVFRPARTLVADPGSFGRPFEEVWLTTGRGVRLHAWYMPSAPDSKLVLFLEGSIGNMSRELVSFEFLLCAGASVLAVDYPGFGRSEGPASESGCYEAAEAAWDYAVHKCGYRPSDVVLFGRSVGGAVAARLATRRQCGALICLGCATSVPDVAAQVYWYLPARFFCYIRFNTLRYLPDCRCPVLVMHSEQDGAIPISHGLRIFQAARPPKRFLRVLGSHYGNEWTATPGLSNSVAAALAGEGWT